MIEFSKNIISHNLTIASALERLNILTESLTLFVLNEENQLVGTLTDGDIRRGLLQGKKLEDPVNSIMYRNFRYLDQTSFTLNDIQEFKKSDIKLIPVLNKNKEIVKIVNLNLIKTFLPLNTIIMAGGKGERLRPLTDTIPKPLLTIESKPIIEHNLDHLINFGINHIHISVNYLKEKIISHLQDGKNKNLKIEYIIESEPLGTIGAIRKATGLEFEHLLVMNADLLTNIDFEEFYSEFLEKKADMAVATIPYQVNIPYAVLEVQNEEIIGFKEKPTYTYYSNAGIYILKKELLENIPENTFFNATDLLETLMQKGKKIIYYPILGYWKDIGQYEDYKQAQEDIKFIKL